MALWIVSSLLILVVIGIRGVSSPLSIINDPYRTLEAVSRWTNIWPTIGSLSGIAKFKADLKVSADSRHEGPDTGRLMVFSFENDSRTLVVLMPPKLAGLFFEKGQNYLVSLEVGEGGLVYADSCEKE